MAKLKKLFSKKAVSPVIAVVLLVALTVAAAAIIYFVVMPMLSVNYELVLLSQTYEDVNEDDYADKMILEFQNLGGRESSITDILITKFSLDLSWTTDATLPSSIGIQGKRSFVLTADTFNDAIKYGDIVVVTLMSGEDSVIIAQLDVPAIYSPFVIMYDENFDGIPDGERPEDWVYTLIATHGGGTHTILDWEVQNDEFRCTKNDCNYLLLDNDLYTFSNVNMSFALRANDDDIMGIIFRYQEVNGDPLFYCVVFSNDHTLTDGRNGPHYPNGDTMQSGKLYLMIISGEGGSGSSNGALTILDSVAWSRNDNTWYNYRVVAAGSNIRVFIDGDLKLETTDSTLTEGKIGIMCGANNNALYDNILVWTGV